MKRLSTLLIGFSLLGFSAFTCVAIDPDTLAPIIVEEVTHYCPKVDVEKLTRRSFSIAGQVSNSSDYSHLRSTLEKVFETDPTLQFLDWPKNKEKIQTAATVIAYRVYPEGGVAFAATEESMKSIPIADGTNTWAMFSLWTGARISNPYKINADRNLVADDGKSDGYIELNLNTRWILRDGQQAYNYGFRRWGWFYFPELDARVGYIFRGEGSAPTNATTGTIVGSSDFYSETAVGWPFFRYKSSSGVWKDQMTLETSGGFTTDKHSLALHPVAFVGFGNQCSFVVNTNDHRQGYWITRAGCALIDQPKLVSGTNTVVFNSIGEPSFRAEWTPSFGTSVVYPLTSTLSLQASFDAYFTDREPASWTASLGVTLDIGKMLGVTQ